jgi:prephenate dehydrogenase
VSRQPSDDSGDGRAGKPRASDTVGTPVERIRVGHGSDPLHVGRVAILGLGQLGGSLALAGRAAGIFDEVVGFGRREESLRHARALHLCDRTTTSAADAVAGAGTVVLSVPLRSIAAVVDAVASAVSPGALVIDVGSVKGTAVRDIESRLPPTVDFVACHPMAGTERFGPDAASAELFTGRRCILCPTPRTSSTAIARARLLWEGVGAVVSTMPADVHDNVMAAVSHLPHVAAYALMAALDGLPPDIDTAARAIPTTSLRDTSRVAASSATMWTDIFLENRDALLPLIDQLSARLGDIRVAIEGFDDARLSTLLESARAQRTKLFPG